MNYVQGGLADGQFVHGGFTLIAVGPPRLAELGGATGYAGSGLLSGQLDSGESDIVYPVGAIQNISLSQNKSFMRVWELGSERSYFIGSRTMGQLGLSRVHYHGASLLRALYAYFSDADYTGAVEPTVPWMFNNLGAAQVANQHDVRIPPGYENLFLNLASDMFNQPIGMLMYVKDSNLDTLGAIYFESVVVPNHGWATDSQGTIVQENVALQYERIVPVRCGSALQLITGTEVAA
jgi:hypothetical protein